MKIIKATSVLGIAAGILIFLSAGCSTMNVLYSPTFDRDAYLPTYSINVYFEEPPQPHFVMGTVSVECTRSKTPLVLEEVKKKAKSIGAHGIIIKYVDPNGVATDVAAAKGLAIPTGGVNRLEVYAIRFAESDF